MNARTQAVDAAMDIEGLTYFPDDSWGEFPEGVDYDDAESIANVVSDVWEPLTRQLLDRLLEFQDGHQCCDADHDGLITRAKEALS